MKVIFEKIQNKIAKVQKSFWNFNLENKKISQSYRIFRNSPLAFHLSTLETTTKPLRLFFLSLSFLRRSSSPAVGDSRYKIFSSGSSLEEKTPTRSQVFWVSSSFALGVKENGSSIFSSVAVRFVKQERFLETKKSFFGVFEIEEIVQLCFDFQRIQIEIKKVLRNIFSKWRNFIEFRKTFSTYF